MKNGTWLESFVYVSFSVILYSYDSTKVVRMSQPSMTLSDSFATACQVQVSGCGHVTTVAGSPLLSSFSILSAKCQSQALTNWTPCWSSLSLTWKISECVFYLWFLSVVDHCNFTEHKICSYLYSFHPDFFPSVLSPAALQALKRKKRYEKQLAQIDGTLSTIEFQREALENANTNTEVLKNMGFAAKAMKSAHENMWEQAPSHCLSSLQFDWLIDVY